MALNTVMLDYPEPNLIEEALKTHDAEHRKGLFGSLKRCDLLTDPVLPPNGIVVGTKWVFKREKEKPPRSS